MGMLLSKQQLAVQKEIARTAATQRASLSTILISKRDRIALKTYYTARMEAARAKIETHNASSMLVNDPVTL